MKSFLLLLSLLLTISCSNFIDYPFSNQTDETIDDSNAKPLSINGTVTFINLEGGFYGIITDNQIKHNPTNLDDSYKTDGLIVSYSFEQETDMVSYHQWGKIITIKEITTNN